MRHHDGTDPEDIGSNPSTEPTVSELIGRRLGRRDALFYYHERDQQTRAIGSLPVLPVIGMEWRF